MVERVSNLSLGEYFQKNIFQPLGVKNITFLPNERMKANVAGMHARDPDGAVRAREHLYSVPLVAQGDDLANLFHSAGGGLYGEVPEYCSKILPPTRF